jgi:AcrR family transcriptional regulator
LTPERRREMTRRHLLEAAALVFADKGFHGATLDEVAAAAGFTKGAVYSNFKSKDDLFLALLDDRIERQFAVTVEVLESGPHERAEQLPRMRELLHGGTFFWDDNWTVLYLEFVSYAIRNPEARAKLVARAERERSAVAALIDREHANAGSVPERSPREFAEISLALFNGLGMARLIDPSAVTNDTLDVALDVLYASMAVDSPE